MVRPDDDDGVVRQTKLLQGFHHAPDLGIDERHGRIISLLGGQTGLDRQVVIGNWAVVSERCGGDVIAVALGCIGIFDLGHRKQLEIFLGRNVRCMRAEEANA